MPKRGMQRLDRDADRAVRVAGGPIFTTALNGARRAMGKDVPITQQTRGSMRAGRTVIQAQEADLLKRRDRLMEQHRQSDLLRRRDELMQRRRSR